MTDNAKKQQTIEERKMKQELRKLEWENSWPSKLLAGAPSLSVLVGIGALLFSVCQWRQQQEANRQEAKEARKNRAEQRVHEQDLRQEERAEDAKNRRATQLDLVLSGDEAQRAAAAINLAQQLAQREGKIHSPDIKEQESILLQLASAIPLERSAHVRSLAVGALAQAAAREDLKDPLGVVLEKLIRSNRAMYYAHRFWQSGNVIRNEHEFQHGPIEAGSPTARAISTGHAIAALVREGVRPSSSPSASPEFSTPPSSTSCPGGYKLDLSNIYCATCDFSGLNVDMSCTNFQDAILQKANLSDANLEGSNFNRTEIAGAWFIQADLQSATFSTLESDDREEVRTENIHWPLLIDVMSKPPSELEFIAPDKDGELYIEGPSFRCADLRNADFGMRTVFTFAPNKPRSTGAYLHPVNFVGADLQGANLEIATKMGFTIPNGKWLFRGNGPSRKTNNIWLWFEFGGEPNQANKKYYTGSFDSIRQSFFGSTWREAAIPDWFQEIMEEELPQWGMHGPPCTPRSPRMEKRTFE